MRGLNIHVYTTSRIFAHGKEQILYSSHRWFLSSQGNHQVKLTNCDRQRRGMIFFYLKDLSKPCYITFNETRNSDYKLGQFQYLQSFCKLKYLLSHLQSIMLIGNTNKTCLRCNDGL